MQKIYLIIQREFLVQIKQKSFIIITLFTPIFILLLFYLLSIISTISINDQSLNFYKIGVIDNNSYLKLQSDQNIFFTYLKINKESSSQNKNFLLKAINNFDALLLIPQEISDNGIDLYLKNNNMDHMIPHLNFLLYKQVLLIKVKKIGVSKKILKVINNLNLNTSYLENNLSTVNSDRATKLVLISIMMYVIMMFILIYGVRIMRSVFEEKNNRIVEIILSSVQPIELMIGKILGTALVALTQFIIWTLFLCTIFLIVKNRLIHNTFYFQNIIQQFSIITPYILNYDYLILICIFLIYFLGGYLLFSSIFAAIGSCIEVDSEPQQFSILASIILLIAFYVGITSFHNPNNMLVLVLSIFPLTSPVVMLSRVSFDIPIWQIILSIFILFFSVFNVMYLASKIYSMNILIHNKRSFFRKIKL